MPAREVPSSMEATSATDDDFMLAVNVACKCRVNTVVGDSPQVFNNRQKKKKPEQEKDKYEY